jgi:hypothetical protein
MKNFKHILLNLSTMYQYLNYTVKLVFVELKLNLTLKKNFAVHVNLQSCLCLVLIPTEMNADLLMIFVG